MNPKAGYPGAHSGVDDPSVRRLLVVEDDPDIARSFIELLAHPRVSITLATNGVEAIGRVKQLRPHAMLLDVWLPVMNGFEVFRVVKRDPLLEGVRVIFISAYATIDTLARATSIGAYAAFQKPFDEEALRKTILAALALEEIPGFAET